jgi:hypothetical protein
MGGDDRDQELVDLLRSIQPPRLATNYWVRIVGLFVETKEHLGIDVAKDMFKTVAAPSKKQQKLLQDKLLWITYESLQTGSKKLTLEQAAQQLYEIRKDGRPVFGASQDAIRKRLLREQRERRRLRDQAAQRLYEEFRKDGRPMSLEAIRERLLRAEIELAEGDPAATELIRKFLTK